MTFNCEASDWASSSCVCFISSDISCFSPTGGMGDPCRSADWHSTFLLVSPFNLSPMLHHNPSSINLWQVEAALGWSWLLLYVSLNWSGSVRTHSVAVRVWKMETATEFWEAYFRLLFVCQWVQWISQHPVWCLNIFQRPRFQEFRL